MLDRSWAVVVATSWLLATQLLVGGVVGWGAAVALRSRRACAGVRRGARELCATAPAGVVVAGLTLAAWWSLGLAPGALVEPVTLLLPGVFTLAGACATSACWLTLRAGRLESAGRLRPARRLARAAGKTAFLSVDVLLLLSVARAFVRPPAELALAASFLGGAACLAVAGFVALLGGLSRKPRPAGVFAVAFLVAGMALLVASGDPR